MAHATGTADLAQNNPSGWIMSRHKPSEKIATRSVRYIDKTVCGRTLVTATLMSGGNWRVTYMYPAIGVDSLTDELEIKPNGPLDSVKKLMGFIAEHWPEFNAGVLALRKVRYAQRSARFKGDDHGKTTAD